jgi:hypothetical protein
LVDRKDTEFWKEASSVDLPDSLAYNLEIWKHRLPIYEDFSDLTRYVLFGPDNFTLILAGLNHFDRDSIRKELEVQSPILIKEADRIVQQLKHSDSNNVYMKHKDFIKLTREYYNAT